MSSAAWVRPSIATGPSVAGGINPSRRPAGAVPPMKYGSDNAINVGAAQTQESISLLRRKVQ